jgi:hypothetical protein
MIKILEFIIEDEEKLIALVQPEGAFEEGTLVEEYYHEREQTIITGISKLSGERERLADCYPLSRHPVERVIEYAYIGRDCFDDSDRQAWLKHGFVTPEQIAPNFQPPLTRRQFNYRKLDWSTFKPPTPTELLADEMLELLKYAKKTAPYFFMNGKRSQEPQELITATVKIPKVYLDILMEDFGVDDPVKAIEAAVEWSSQVYRDLTMVKRLDEHRLEGFDDAGHPR